MDVIVLRSLSTLFMFLVFVGIVVWSLAARRRKGFDEAAQLPFLEDTLDDVPAASAQGENRE